MQETLKDAKAKEPRLSEGSSAAWTSRPAEHFLGSETVRLAARTKESAKHLTAPLKPQPPSRFDSFDGKYAAERFLCIFSSSCHMHRERP